jgi:hypothetical protein
LVEVLAGNGDMADPAYTPDHPASSQLTHAGQPEDDEIIYSTPHRELIRQVGKLARAEQEPLELECLRLREYRTKGRGVFSADEGTGRSSGAIPTHMRPTPLLIFFVAIPALDFF